MATQTVTLMGRQYVLVPKKDYERMRSALDRQERQDRGDVAEARRRARERSVPLSEVRKRLRL